MPTMDQRIKALKTRQKSLLMSFNLTKTFVDKYDEQRDAQEIPVRLESLNELWTNYNKVQAELEAIDEASIDELLKQRTEYETAYYRVKGFLLSMNKSPVSVNPGSSSSSSNLPAPSSHVRLPDVKLPVFSGNYDDWLNFHDLYVSLVHSSTELSNIQKFYYLRSSLAGEALQLVQTITLSANNYVVAWNMLVQHYQNSTRLKQSYLDTLFEFSTLKRESAADLHSLVEKFEANVKVLKQLGERTEHWSIILIRMLSVRLDSTTRRDWEEFSSTKDAVTFEDLTNFIQRRVTVLQTIQGNAVDTPASTQLSKKPPQHPLAYHGASKDLHRSCVICSEHHPLYMCESFSQLSLDDKEIEIRRHQICCNCLRKGHLSRDCLSSSNCRRCRARHHTQLCPTSSSVSNPESETASVQPSDSGATTSTNQLSTTSASAMVAESVSYANACHLQKTILLATAVIFIVDDDGTKHVARALLDSGSECSFITERFSQRIKVQRKRIHLPITGIGQTKTQAKTKFGACIRSRVGEYSTNVEFVVLPNVTIDLPAASINISSWDMPPGIHLADPSFHNSSQVDVIIGAEIFFDLFRVPGRIPLGNNLPMLINSTLGWIVCGKSEINSSTPVVAHFATATARLPAKSSCEDHLQTAEKHNIPHSKIEQYHKRHRKQPEIIIHQPKHSSSNANPKQSNTALFECEATANADTHQPDALPAEEGNQSRQLEINDHRIENRIDRPEPKTSPNVVNNSELNHLHCSYISSSASDDRRSAPNITPTSSSEARRTSVLEPFSAINLIVVTPSADKRLICRRFPGMIVHYQSLIDHTTCIVPDCSQNRSNLHAPQLDGKQRNPQHPCDLGSTERNWRKTTGLLLFYQRNCITGARADENKHSTGLNIIRLTKHRMHMHRAIVRESVNEVIKLQTSHRLMGRTRTSSRSLLYPESGGSLNEQFDTLFNHRHALLAVLIRHKFQTTSKVFMAPTINPVSNSEIIHIYIEENNQLFITNKIYLYRQDSSKRSSSS